MADREWWINDIGDNMLAGIPCDPCNPSRLSDETIVDFLQRIPAAFDSFFRLLPTMLPEEQCRLEWLVSGSPGLKPLTWDTISDTFQHRLNTMKVQRGGGWMPPPFGTV